MNLDRQWIWLLAVIVGHGALVVPILRRGRDRWAGISAVAGGESNRFSAWKRVPLTLYVLLSMLWACIRGMADWTIVPAALRAVVPMGMAYGLVILSSLLGLLTAIFITDGRSLSARSRPTSSRRLWIWSVAGAGIVLAMAALDWSSVEWAAWSAVSVLGPSMSLAIVGWVSMAGAAYFLSWNAYRQMYRPLYRNRLRYWLLILILTLSGDSLFVLFGFPYYQWGTLLRWLGTALAVIALLSFHLPDLSGVARHVLRYLALTLLTALIFLGGIYLAYYVVSFVPFAQNVLIGAAGVALILAVLDPFLRRGMRRLLTKLLFGEGYDRERILREYGQGVSNILDLNVLATTAIGIIGKAMKVQRGALLVCEEVPQSQANAFSPNAFTRDALRLRLVPGRGTGEYARLDVQPLVVGAESTPVAYMARTGMALLQYDIDLLPQFQDMSPAQRAWFSSLDMEIYVPIRAQSRLLGILVLGPKGSGTPYSSSDIALLRTLAGQTAIALENARLVEDLKRLNAEIIQLNQDLTETNDRLAILDKTKSDFISIASHELKTPLTHIMGYADMLGEYVHAVQVREEATEVATTGEQAREEATEVATTGEQAREGATEVATTGEQVREEATEVATTGALVRKEATETGAVPAESVRAIVQGISKGAKRLQDVVDAMLDVSLIETEAFAVHPISISLKHMIDQVLEGLEDAIRERHQVVTRDGLDALPDILADGMRLHQAFRNLIVNSIKFTPDGGRIDIRARMVEDGQYVEVAIADTGIGIDAQHQDLIFEKFYRVGDLNLHSTGQTKFKGAGPGLGLPIARGIIEAHGGKIWVESGGHNEETFPGSTFYVRLPVDGPTAQQGRVTL